MNRLEKLIKFRKLKSFTQKEMYKKLGFSKSYYEKIEYGINEAGKGFIQRMIETFPEDRNKILKIFF